MKASRERKASPPRSNILLTLGVLVLIVSLMTWPSAVSGQDATPIASSTEVVSVEPTATSTTAPAATEAPTDVPTTAPSTNKQATQESDFSIAAESKNNPPGNNGTVKIDGEDIDSGPGNEPHVGCIFNVDFYNFDVGDNYADVLFEVQPPTGSDVILNDTGIFIGGGPIGPNGLVASRSYDLTPLLVGIYEPHPI